MPEQNGRPLQRPLYQSVGPSEFERTDANAGLWYDKFGPPPPSSHFRSAPGWEGASWSKAKANKLNWIRSVVGLVGCPKLVDEFTERYKQLATKVGGRVVSLQTESRFVTGLGREHPIENGFAWHHTLGVPYLSGSSLKGLIRNWAEQWTDGPVDKNEVNDILGGSGCVGRVILLDVLPEVPTCLEADVMTPHYSDYYQRGDAPGDWLSPTPIPFLVVAAGTRFQFPLLPRTPGDTKHLEVVAGWIIGALSWLGAGAKTAVGYGRFTSSSIHIGDNLMAGESGASVTGHPNESQQRVSIPRTPVQIPVISAEDLKDRLAQLQKTQIIFKVGEQSSGVYSGYRINSAPKIPRGYQAEGNWTLIDGPQGLGNETLVIAAQQESSKRAVYLEVFGRLPPAQSDKKTSPKRK